MPSRQVTLAGGRGTQAYQQAVAEGYEIPRMATAALTTGGSDGRWGLREIPRDALLVVTQI